MNCIQHIYHIFSLNKFIFFISHTIQNVLLPIFMLIISSVIPFGQTNFLLLIKNTSNNVQQWKNLSHVHLHHRHIIIALIMEMYDIKCGYMQVDVVKWVWHVCLKRKGNKFIGSLVRHDTLCAAASIHYF